MHGQNRQDLTKQIEHLFTNDVRAETSLGLATRLGVDEDEALDVLIGMVSSGQLHVIEEGSLLIFLTPAYSRALKLAA